MKKQVFVAGVILIVQMCHGCAGGTMLKLGDPARPLVDGKGQPARGLAGEPISLKQLYAKGPVMLVFLRGFS